MPEIAYELIRSRRKTVSIIIAEDARVVVRAPLRAPKAEIESFMRLKHAWIVEKQAIARMRLDLHQPASPENGEEFPYLGQKLLLAASDRVQRVEAVGGALAFPKAKLADAEALLKKWYLSEAARVLAERVRHWSAVTGIPVASVRITDARKRWGSCAMGGRLNFTWRLVTAPVDVIDYVVVHELTHVLHMNHSKEFWACVGRIQPDYKKKKQWLKDNNALLRLF